MSSNHLQLWPLLVGFCMNLWLSGVVVMQGVEYYRYSRRDSSWVPYFVTAVLFADVWNAGLCFTSLYYLFITGHDNIAAIVTRPRWFQAGVNATTGIVACAVQLFFAYRLKRLTQLNWMIYVIATMSLGQAVASIMTSHAFTLTNKLLDPNKYRFQLITWLSLAALADILIAGTFVVFARRNRTGYPATDDLMTRMSWSTIQTGSLTTICTIVDLVLFSTTRGTLHLLFNFPLCKLYTISLMSSLNARTRWAHSTITPQTSGGQHTSGSRGATLSTESTLRCEETWSKSRPSKATSIAREVSEMVELGVRNGIEDGMGMPGSPPGLSPIKSTFLPTKSTFSSMNLPSFPPSPARKSFGSPKPTSLPKRPNAIRTAETSPSPTLVSPVGRFSPTMSIPSPFRHSPTRPLFAPRASAAVPASAAVVLPSPPPRRSSLSFMSTSPSRHDKQIIDLSNFDMEAQEEWPEEEEVQGVAL